MRSVCVCVCVCVLLCYEGGVAAGVRALFDAERWVQTPHIQRPTRLCLLERCGAGACLHFQRLQPNRLRHLQQKLPSVSSLSFNFSNILKIFLTRHTRRTAGSKLVVVFIINLLLLLLLLLVLQWS